MQADNLTHHDFDDLLKNQSNRYGLLCTQRKNDMSYFPSRTANFKYFFPCTTTQTEMITGLYMISVTEAGHLIKNKNEHVGI